MEQKRKVHGYSSFSEKNIAIKDVDLQSRTVAGYFAAFGNVDSDGDMFMAGAFDKSISDRGVDSTSNRKIMHLAFHDTRRPVGQLKVLKTDEKGLYFESELGTHTDGEDALKMYESGIIREHSVGFQYIPDKMKWIDLEEGTKAINATEEGAAFMDHFGGYYALNEVKLWEGSYVTFGANSETPNLGVIKSAEQRSTMLKELNERMELIIKEISNGTYSDNIFPMLEAELAYVKTVFNSLINVEPSIKDTLHEEPNDGREFLLKSLLNNKTKS